MEMGSIFLLFLEEIGIFRHILIYFMIILNLGLTCLLFLLPLRSPFTTHIAVSSVHTQGSRQSLLRLYPHDTLSQIITT